MKRTGTTNDACFRVVAADVRSPRDGKNLETLGWYNPGAKGKTFELKLDRVDHWLGEGAQISDTVASLVKKARKAPATAVAGSVAKPVAAIDAAPQVEAAAETVPAVEAPDADAN
jgi:small subunit ribosomal protein S16